MKSDKCVAEIKNENVTQILLLEETGHLFPLQQVSKAMLKNQPAKLVMIGNDLVKLYELTKRGDFNCIKSHHQQGIVNACQVSLIDKFKQGNQPSYVTGDCIAYSTILGDICLFNITTGVQLHYFYAHDDLITGLAYFDHKLVSVSKDQTIKLWDLRQPLNSQDSKNFMVNNQIVLFDHTAPIVGVDILKK